VSDRTEPRTLAECIEELLAAAGLPDYQTFSESLAYRLLVGLPERPETRERKRLLREFVLGLPLLPPLLAGPMPELVLDEPAPPAPMPRGHHPRLLIIDDPVRDPAGGFVYQGSPTAGAWGSSGAFVVESPLVPEGTAVVARLPEPTPPRPEFARLPSGNPASRLPLYDPKTIFSSLGGW
jgi:hypothetical protein